MKWNYGRRYAVIFGVLVGIMIIEISECIYRIITSDATLVVGILFTIQGQLIFTMYYAICILGPMDIAKSEMLKRNMKFGGIMLCFTLGFSFTAASVIFDNLILLYVDEYDQTENYMILKAIELFSTICAILCMKRII